MMIDWAGEVSAPGMGLPESILEAERDLWRHIMDGDGEMVQQAAAHGAKRCLDLLGWPENSLSVPTVPHQPRHWSQIVQVAAPTAVLLLDDGDPRSALSVETGLNRYGCAPLPQSRTIALSACSGNEIGPVGLAAAQDLRLRLMQAAWDGRLEDEIELVACSQQSTMATLLNLRLRPGDSVALTQSGTQAVRHVAQYFGAGHQACLYLIVGKHETGSDVPQAVAVGPHVTVQTVELRDEDTGTAKSSDGLVADLAERIQAAHAENRHVVLQVMEGSKTGLVAPGVSGVRALVERFPQGLSIVADCCQMRPGTQAAEYWDLGAAVVATGSKFLGGPAFSGIAFIPGGGTAPPAPVGTVLRWQAALAESDGYGHLSAVECAAGLQVFQNLFLAQCQQSLGLLAVRDRYPSHVMTVMVSDAKGQLLDMERLRRLNGWLRRDAGSLLGEDASPQDRDLAGQRCLIGQPVSLGKQAGLRLAMNAGRLVNLVQDSQGVSKLAKDLGMVLAKMDLIRAYC